MGQGSAHSGSYQKTWKEKEVYECSTLLAWPGCHAPAQIELEPHVCPLGQQTLSEFFDPVDDRQSSLPDKKGDTMIFLFIIIINFMCNFWICTDFLSCKGLLIYANLYCALDMMLVSGCFSECSLCCCSSRQVQRPHFIVKLTPEQMRNLKKNHSYVALSICSRKTLGVR